MSNANISTGPNTRILRETRVGDRSNQIRAGGRSSIAVRDRVPWSRNTIDVVTNATNALTTFRKRPGAKMAPRAAIDPAATRLACDSQKIMFVESAP